MTMNTTIFGAYTDRGGTRPENQDSVISRAIQGPAVPEKSRSPFAMLGRSKMKEKAACNLIEKFDAMSNNQNVDFHLLGLIM